MDVAERFTKDGQYALRRDSMRRMISRYEFSCRLIARELPTMVAPHATEAEVKVALKELYPFGMRKYWPYKAWLRARRQALRAWTAGRFAQFAPTRERQTLHDPRQLPLTPVAEDAS
jgi:hypothetical protein